MPNNGRKNKSTGGLELDFGTEDVSAPIEINPANAEPNPSSAYNYVASVLALSRIYGVGYKTVKAIDRYIGLESVWDIPYGDLDTMLSKAKVPIHEKIAKQINTNGKSLLDQGSNDYENLLKRGVSVLVKDKIPEPLRCIPDPPLWLFVEGDIRALEQPFYIGLVGTRDASERGIDATVKTTEIIAAYPLAIISGLADGIDAEAHFQTLQRNIKNVAFLGHGINHIFPRATADTRKRIVQQGGAVVTEYLPNEKYHKAYFVQRNRLQAALSNILIPIEATATGGTSHTVRFAMQYKRMLIGIRWEGANGILSELERNKYPIVDIFTREGKKELDVLIQDSLTDLNQDSYPFSIVENRLLREIGYRRYLEEDVHRLVKRITELLSPRGSRELGEDANDV